MSFKTNTTDTEVAEAKTAKTAEPVEAVEPTDARVADADPDAVPRGVPEPRGERVDERFAEEDAPVEQSVEAPAERPVAPPAEIPAEDVTTNPALREPDLAAHGIVNGADGADTPADENALLERWSEIQVFFVKDPHAAVAEADALIAEIVEARRKAFDAHRAALTGRWQAEGADTEDLRLTLHDYRKLISVLFPRQT